MHAAERALFFIIRYVALDTGEIDVVFLEFILAERARKKAPLVPRGFDIYQERAIQRQL
jgi:hypothetical protein